jgi:ATP-binding protein involved in chromosome partitioning
MIQNNLAPKALPGIKNVILVASGKGGVGKSSVAVNLAVALAKNHKVGLLDADIYGPSIPRMMGVLGQRPLADETGKIQPLLRYQVKMMSIGFMIEDATSVVWRGPMLFKAVDQFLYDINWGELDYLVIDLPPGTGDIQLTLAQKVIINGAIVVSTPQNISLTDVKKAVDMFERSGVPILGVIENMSYFVNPVNGDKIQLFPRGELDQYLDQKNIIKIGEIPFNPKIAQACETGVPILNQNQQDQTQTEVKEFYDICEHLVDMLEGSELQTAAPAVSFNADQASKVNEQKSPASTGGGCGGNCSCN